MKRKTGWLLEEGYLRFYSDYTHIVTNKHTYILKMSQSQ